MSARGRGRPQSPVVPGASSAELGDVLGFMRLLWAIAHGLESGSKQMQVSIGVTGPQRLVVRLIGRYPQISPGELAHILQLHPSSLTGVLKRLERANLIERRTDSDDGRRAVLRLTTKGKRLDAKRAGTVEAAVSTALSALPKRTIHAAETALKQVAVELALRWGTERVTFERAASAVRPAAARGSVSRRGAARREARPGAE